MTDHAELIADLLDLLEYADHPLRTRSSRLREAAAKIEALLVERDSYREALEDADEDLRQLKKITAESSTSERPWALPNQIAAQVYVARLRIATVLAAGGEQLPEPPYDHTFNEASNFGDPQ